MSTSSMLTNQFKTFALLISLTVLLLFVGQFFGGVMGLSVAFAFVLLMNLGTYFFSHKLVLMMYRAKEVKRKEYPKLFGIVKDVADRAGIPMPKVYIVPSPSPNAFATGRNPKNAVVACTQGILHLLDDDELRGVIAHEVAHIKNRDILVQTVASTIAGVISYAAMIARFGAIFGGFGGDRDGNNILGLLAMMILAPLIALIIQLAISRSREYLADETGARTIDDPDALARALAKLEKGIAHVPMRGGNDATSSLFIANPFRGRALAGLFSTHPPMEERIRRLHEMK